MKTHAFDPESLSGAIHAIPAPSGKGKISAYYDRGGSLSDAEHIIRPGISRQIKWGGPLWQWIANQGFPAKVRAEALRKFHASPAA